MDVEAGASAVDTLLIIEMISFEGTNLTGANVGTELLSSSFPSQSIAGLKALTILQPIRCRAARWAHVCFGPGAVGLFSPTIALSFEAADCCGRARGSWGRHIQSFLLILRPMDRSAVGQAPVPAP